MATADERRDVRIAAEKAAAVGDFEHAGVLYEKAALSATDGRARMRAAEYFLKSGNHDRALANQVAAARDYAADGDFVRSLAVSKRILAKDPDNSEIRGLLAFTFDEAILAGDIDEATTSDLDRVKRSAGITDRDAENVLAGPGSSLSSEQADQILARLPEMPLFKFMKGPEALALIDQMRLVEADVGRLVVRQDEPGNSFYIVTDGRLEAQIRTQEGMERTLSMLMPGDFFGELSCILGTPRTASVVARTRSELLEISNLAIQNLARDFPQFDRVLASFSRERLINSAFESSAVLRRVRKASRSELVESLELIDYEAGSTIIEQGKAVDGLYLIATGEVLPRSRFRGGRRIAYPTMLAGDLFGEISLVLQRPATASCVAVTDCKLFRITANALGKVLRKHPGLSKDIKDLAAERMTRSNRIAGALRK